MGGRASGLRDAEVSSVWSGGIGLLVGAAVAVAVAVRWR